MRSCDLFDGQAEDFDPPASGGLSQTIRNATRAIANVNAGSAPAHPHPLQLKPAAVDRGRELLRDDGGMCAFVNTALLRSRLGRTADQSRQASRLSPPHPSQRVTDSPDVLPRGILEERPDHILDGFTVRFRRLVSSATNESQLRADREGSGPGEPMPPAATHASQHRSARKTRLQASTVESAGRVSADPSGLPARRRLLSGASYARGMPGAVRNMLWGGAGLVVAFGWVLGYGIWTPESPGREFGSFFDLWVPGMTVLLGAPLATVAGFLLSRRGTLRTAGYALLGVTCLLLAYLASYAFFGGICLDPGDECVTTWPSRIGELGVALGCLTAGWVVHRWAGGARRKSRHANHPATS